MKKNQALKKVTFLSFLFCFRKNLFSNISFEQPYFRIGTQFQSIYNNFGDPGNKNLKKFCPKCSIDRPDVGIKFDD